MHRTRTAMLVALMAVTVVSCGSSTDETAPAPTDTTASPSTTPATNDTSTGLDDYCALFSDIQAATSESELNSEAAWQQRVEWTREIARLAPDGYQDQAAVYLALVLAREQLVSGYGYVPVQELPADVRTAFISGHLADQQISNELITFSTSTCLPPTTTSEAVPVDPVP